MDHTVVHFEIPADEPERAAKFYRELFGWEIQRWGNAATPEGSATGTEYWMVRTVPTDLVAGDTNGAADVFVHDRGTTAADQITDLPTLARSCYLQPKGVETSLVRKLQNALAAVNAGDLATACTLLSDFRDCSPGFWWHLGDRWREILHRSARIRNTRRLEITWCSCIRLLQHVQRGPGHRGPGLWLLDRCQ